MKGGFQSQYESVCCSTCKRWQVGVDVELFAKQHGPSSTYICWDHCKAILISLNLPTVSFEQSKLSKHQGQSNGQISVGTILIDSDDDAQQNLSVGRQPSTSCEGDMDSAAGSSRKRCLSQGSDHQRPALDLPAAGLISVPTAASQFMGKPALGGAATATASSVLSKILRQSSQSSFRSTDSKGHETHEQSQSQDLDSEGVVAVGAQASQSSQPSRSGRKRSTDMVSDLAALHTNLDAIAEMQRTMSPEQLVQLLRSASAVIAEKTEKERHLQSVNKSLKKHCNQLAKDTSRLKDLMKTNTVSLALRKVQRIQQSQLDMSALELKTRGKSGKRLCANSVLALGIRRNFSNIAACDFGETVLFPVSHQTVTRCETRTCSAIKSQFQVWVQDHYELCKTIAKDGSEDSFSVMGVLIRADATNSNIWRRQKLHVCEATVGFLDNSNTELVTRRCLNLGREAERYSTREIRTYP